MSNSYLLQDPNEKICVHNIHSEAGILDLDDALSDVVADKDVVSYLLFKFHLVRYILLSVIFVDLVPLSCHAPLFYIFCCIIILCGSIIFTSSVRELSSILFPVRSNEIDFKYLKNILCTLNCNN